MNNPKKIIFFIGLAFFFLWTACSGDKITENIHTDGAKTVNSLNERPSCNSDAEGDRILVKDDGIIYVCSEKKWSIYAYVSESISTNENCNIKQLPNDIGVTLFCNGDSVGTILNGKPGLEGKDGSDCKITSSDKDTVVITCGDSSFKISLAEIAPKEYLFKNLNINGFTQKGPFINGSEVIVFELVDGRSLNQTGRVYKGNIISSDGQFNINVISLASQYILVTGSGYYLNEVTGKKSTGSISLMALTDITERNKVNINLLTHLEYFRVLNLVKHNSMSIGDAKKQANEEIFTAFHIASKNFSSTEDLNIFSTGDDNAALLAISILLQRNHNTSELIEELSILSNDLADDGLWNGKESERIKHEMVEWAFNMDTKDSLPTIYKHIKNWHISDNNIPDFEQYIRNFWYQEAGWGLCTDENASEIQNIKNPSSRYYSSSYNYSNEAESQERFICEKNKWRAASDFEKDTYQWKCVDGAIVDEDGVVHNSTQPLRGRVNRQNSYICHTSSNTLVAVNLSYHGTVYHTTYINGKRWFLNNLEYVPDEYQNHALYANNPSLGIFYPWGVAMDTAGVLGKDALGCEYGKECSIKKPARGLCPEGWHIPTLDDWTSLYKSNPNAFVENPTGYCSIHPVWNQEVMRETLTIDNCQDTQGLFWWTSSISEKNIPYSWEYSGYAITDKYQFASGKADEYRQKSIVMPVRCVEN